MFILELSYVRKDVRNDRIIYEITGRERMEKVKKALDRIFIEGLSAMAHGLFATLIIGTIIQQIGTFMGGNIGEMIFIAGKLAASLTGAGIGVAVAYKFKEAPLVVVSAATAGMAGAFASSILAGKVFVDGAMVFAGPGEPLGAFIAAYVGIFFGHMVSGKTKVDILVTPVVTIGSGCLVGFLIGPPISEFMSWLGSLINWGTEQQPFLMGIIVSVLMGMILTLPISSAALGVILNLSGLAAGAATVGCCCNMLGFAVISYPDNGVGGLVAQGLGTSMLQVPNLMRKPVLWIPPVLTSAILGPVATCIFQLRNNGAAISSGMGTAGLVGPIGIITGWSNMPKEYAPGAFDWVGMILVCFILPVVLSWAIGKFMRKKGWIKEGDLKVDLG